MRSIGLVIIASVCALGGATPARALAELQNCDTEKDPTKRMVCLQAHISHLEETLLSLSAEVVGLRHELKEMLAAKAVYKVQYVGKGGCLNFSGDNKPPVVGSCDSPDSWKLVLGAQSPPKQATPKPGAPGSAQTPAPDAKTGTSAKQGTTAKPAAPGSSPEPAAAGAGANKPKPGAAKPGAASTVPKTAPPSQ